MRENGWILIAIGTIWLVIAFNLDTSVATGGSSFLPDRVENIGLIARRQNHLFVSGLLILIGALMAIFGRGKEEQGTARHGTVTPPTRKAPPAERDIQADSYRLWLVETYGVTKNDVLARFVIGEQTFATLDDALAFAHAEEEEALAEAHMELANAEVEAQAEELRWELRLRELEEEAEVAAEKTAAEWERTKPKLIAGGIVTLAISVGAVAYFAS